MDRPKVLKRTITPEIRASRERDMETVLDNYRENLRDHGVTDDAAIERFVSEEHSKMQKEYESLVPLPEVISTCMGYSTASKKVQGCFEQMIQTLGTEFDILRNVPSEDIKSCAGERIAEGIENVRTGNVKRIPGYDGEYGKIELFEEN